MVSLSPLMSNFGALLNGLITVRAFCAEPAFPDTSHSGRRQFPEDGSLLLVRARMVAVSLRHSLGFSTFLLTILAIYSNLTPGLTAFVLIAAQKFVQSTHTLCRPYGNFNLTSSPLSESSSIYISRTKHLFHHSPASWPSYNSTIEFRNVTVHYTPKSPQH